MAIGAFPLLGVVDVRGTVGVELLDVQQVRLKGPDRLLGSPGLTLLVEEGARGLLLSVRTALQQVLTLLDLLLVRLWCVLEMVQRSHGWNSKGLLALGRQI